MRECNIGFSTGFFGAAGLSTVDRLKIITSLPGSAVELCLHSFEDISDQIIRELLPLTKPFTYISVHLPCDIRYPGPEIERYLSMVKHFIQQAKVETLVLHPDVIDDFPWINNTFGSLLALENMDSTKAFGNTLPDMMKVFEWCPQARWVCDVNHVFTNDRSMKLGVEFHTALGNRLAHYHASGYGTKIHTFVSQTHEDAIIDGILDLSKPIILEGGEPCGVGMLTAERDYIQGRIHQSHPG